MSHILNQRKAVIASLITIAITVHGLVIEHLADIISIAKKWNGLFKFILSGGFIYSAIIILPLYFYDRYFWRLINSKYDLQGKWEVRITKLKCLNIKHVTDEGLDECEHLAGKIISSSVICSIQQTPFRSWVEEATGQSIAVKSSAMITYTAEIIGVNLPGKILVVFDAVVDGSVSGRDHLTVHKRDRRKRPIVLIGDAYHVFTNLDLVIRGEIVYHRLGKKGKLCKDKDFDSFKVSASQIRLNK
jgi:hypothetical protein